MLRKGKDNSEYEIDRELTGKFAIEKNAEYQEKIEQLEEENKVIKEEKEMLIRQNTLLQESNKKLKEEVEQLKNQRIFSSDEYYLITLTSTTPQWELRRK